MPAAVIFDCDGVLVNSEEIYRRIETERLAAIGLRYDPDDYAERFLGVTIDAYASGLDSDFRRQYGRPLPEGFIDHLLAVTLEAVKRELAAHDGVLDVVRAIGAAKAVASSSGQSRLETKLRQVGLFDHFAPHVYSADAVRHGKPAPDLFLHAAASLEVAPADCVVIEDSVNGVKAGVAAGMRVVGYVGGRHCSPRQAAQLRAAGAREVIDHFDQLLDTVRALTRDHP